MRENCLRKELQSTSLHDPKITCVPSMARNVQGRLHDLKKSLTSCRWYFRINVVSNIMPAASYGALETLSQRILILNCVERVGYDSNVG